MNKSYLFFFVHPAKFHLFKHTINKLKLNGYKVSILIVSKDVLEQLIQEEGWDYTNLFPRGRKVKFLPAKIVAIFSAILTIIKLFKFLIFNKRYNIFITDDILVIPGFFLRIPTYFFVDNDYKTLSFGKYLLPFASKIISPASTDLDKFGYKKISFKGNKAIAHLSPKYFTANKKIIKNLNDVYFLLRLSNLNAIHDDRQNKGIENGYLKRIINYLKDYGDVLISSERKLPMEYEKYRLNIPPKDISDFVNFAKIVITDSGTMATESAVLGVPNILLNSLASKCGVHVELNRKFELQYYYDKFEDVFLKLKEMMSDKDLNIKWQKRRRYFLSEIDDFPLLLYKELTKSHE